MMILLFIPAHLSRIYMYVYIPFIPAPLRRLQEHLRAGGRYCWGILKKT